MKNCCCAAFFAQKTWWKLDENGQLETTWKDGLNDDLDFCPERMGLPLITCHLKLYGFICSKQFEEFLPKSTTRRDLGYPDPDPNLWSDDHIAIWIICTVPSRYVASQKWEISRLGCQSPCLNIPFLVFASWSFEGTTTVSWVIAGILGRSGKFCRILFSLLPTFGTSKEGSHRSIKSTSNPFCASWRPTVGNAMIGNVILSVFPSAAIGKSLPRPKTQNPRVAPPCLWHESLHWGGAWVSRYRGSRFSSLWTSSDTTLARLRTLSQIRRGSNRGE